MRTFILRRRRGGATIAAAFLFACAAHAAEPDFVPSPDLLAAAKKEGKIVLYTANFLETEQAVVKRFAERFPGIQIEIVRAPTGQLMTRIKTEAAANRMIADVIDIVRTLCAAERRRLSRRGAHGRPPMATLWQRLDYNVQLRARDRPAEVVG